MCASGHSYLVHAPPETLTHYVGRDGFGVYPHRFSPGSRYLPIGTSDKYRAGEPIARRVRGHGRPGVRGQVHLQLPVCRSAGTCFVFSTRDIEGIPMEDPTIKSQFYIKRLAGCRATSCASRSRSCTSTVRWRRNPGFKRVMTAVGRLPRVLEHRMCQFPAIAAGHVHVPAKAILRWATTVSTVRTAATGAWCPRTTWSGAGCSFTGPSRGIGEPSIEGQLRRWVSMTLCR